ncbi:MAG TPA: biotin/lipoyl-containing protein, partial [Acidimicrobiales bacterium]|nr:biotin/lipoyl-containing protein [Acidimicrobiales bacterium]
MAEITMPQLGETVTEGTITRWAKKVGDSIAEDEILFEVSTDKVDSEVPSPVAGVLSEILVPEGETVDVGTRLAVISAGGEAPAPAKEKAAAPAEPAPAEEPAVADPAPAEKPSPAASNGDGAPAAPPGTAAPAPAPEQPSPAAAEAPGAEETGC